MKTAGVVFSATLFLILGTSTFGQDLIPKKSGPIISRVDSPASGIHLSSNALAFFKLFSHDYAELTSRKSVMGNTNRALLSQFSQCSDPEIVALALSCTAWDIIGVYGKALQDHVYNTSGPAGLGLAPPRRPAIDIDDPTLRKKWDEVVANRVAGILRKRQEPTIADVAGDLEYLFREPFKLLNKIDSLSLACVYIYLHQISEIEKIVSSAARDIPVHNEYISLQAAPAMMFNGARIQPWRQGFFDITNRSGLALTNCTLVLKVSKDRKRVEKAHGDAPGILNTLPILGGSDEFTDTMKARAKIQVEIYAIDQDAVCYIPSIPANGCVRVKPCYPASMPFLDKVGAALYCNQFRAETWMTSTQVSNLVSAWIRVEQVEEQRNLETTKRMMRSRQPLPRR